MVDFIRGEIAELTPAYVVIDANGVGYGLSISVNTYSAIHGQKDVKLYVYEAIREDAYDLYGFLSKREREVFLMLITVNGIGANTARMILSEMTLDELCGVIAAGNDKMLKRIKGIGPKSAARIIVELSDKFNELEFMGAGMAQNASNVNMEVVNEAVSALTMLGFAAGPTHKVVNEIVKDNPDISVEQLIKRALTMIK